MKDSWVIRTRDGLLIGPFATHPLAQKWAGDIAFHVEDIHLLVPPRGDMIGPKVANTVAAQPARGEHLHDSTPAFKSRREPCPTCGGNCGQCGGV